MSIWPKPVQYPHPPLLMSGGSDGSAKLAAEHRSSMGVLRIQDYETAHRSINIYKKTARANGWEPKPENIMLAMNCSVAPTAEEAIDTLKKGYEYFFGVLGGGLRTAQKLVVQKTRYYSGDEDAERQRKKFDTHKQLT